MYNRSVPPKHHTMNSNYSNTSNNNPGSGYAGNNRNQPWKGGPTSRNNSQWGANPASPWGAVGDGSRPTGYPRTGPGGYTTSNGPRISYGGSRPNNGNFRDIRNDRERRSNRGSPPHDGSSPLGAITQMERTDRWNPLPSHLVAEEAAAAQERNRHALIAREAERTAAGIGQPAPGHHHHHPHHHHNPHQQQQQPQYQIIETSKQFVAADDGTIQRALKTTRVTDGFNDVRASPLSVAVPKGPTAKPSRFFPSETNNNNADNVISKIGGQGNFEEKDEPKPAGCPSSPPPPMSADHPVHGDTVTTRVYLPASMAAPPVAVSENILVPAPASSFKKFEEVQKEILELIPGTLLGPPTMFATTRSKPSFETTRDIRLKVSLPSQAESTAGDLSMFTIPDSEQFITELFEQDFGSTPNVKLPRSAPQYSAIPNPPGGNAVTASTASIKAAAKKIFKCPKGLFQSSDIFIPFSAKDFTNSDGLRYYPVRVPGGIYKEVPIRSQDKNGRSKHSYPKKKNNGRRNGDVRN